MAHGRRLGGGIGSGRLEGGIGEWVVSGAHTAPGGRCVRASQGLGAVERWRWHGGGTGAARG
jgi:hypothetical protein